jgi:hypothetical protein
VGDKADSSE